MPSSKSHTIRAIFLASLAHGVSTVKGRLQSADADSAISACRALGAEIDESGDTLTIRGTAGKIKPRGEGEVVDVGNSGTTARFVLSMASLSDAPVTIDGDEQTRKRPMGPLLKSLSELGATVIKDSQGRLPVTLPVTITGPIKGGITTVDGTTSQYLSSLLLHAPFCETETTLKVESLNEKPYVDMTCAWLEKMQIEFSRKGYGEFVIPPAQKIKAFSATVPADFSSAAFFLALAAIPGSEVEITGLDMDDTQGDKKVIDLLKGMGAKIECPNNGLIKIIGTTLKGATIDLNDTPDALPAMAVVGCLADGQTRLTNVPQARIKETDRIAVMAKELKKMGADIEEESDGLVIRKSNLNGAKLNGHDDHRVVMSLAVAGLAASGTTEIDTAQAINVTFPNFVELMKSCGANMNLRRA